MARTWKQEMERQNSYAAQFPQFIGNLINLCPDGEHDWRERNRFEDICDKCALLRYREDRFRRSKP